MRYPSLKRDDLDKLRQVAAERKRMPTNRQLAEQMHCPVRTIRYWLEQFAAEPAEQPLSCETSDSTHLGLSQ